VTTWAIDLESISTHDTSNVLIYHSSCFVKYISYILYSYAFRKASIQLTELGLENLAIISTRPKTTIRSSLALIRI